MRRRTLGGPCAFMNGHLFFGIYRDLLWVRLSPEDREALLAEPGARPYEPIPGNMSTDSVVVPRAWLGEPDRIAPWVARAMTYVQTLGPRRAKG